MSAWIILTLVGALRGPEENAEVERISAALRGLLADIPNIECEYEGVLTFTTLANGEMN